VPGSKQDGIKFIESFKRALSSKGRNLQSDSALSSGSRKSNGGSLPTVGEDAKVSSVSTYILLTADYKELIISWQFCI